jgi:hypothetical protein
VVAGVVMFGLSGAVLLSVLAGAPAASLPGVALGSEALLLAERAMALFAIWMSAVVIVLRALRDQLPIEISSRGVRYAEAEDVVVKDASAEAVLRDVDGEMRWLRKAVLDLLDPVRTEDRKERVDESDER